MSTPAPPVTHDGATTVMLRMSLACPYSSCGSGEIAEITTDDDQYPVYIADDKVVSASGLIENRTSGHAGFICTDCGRPVSLPPGWTYQRSYLRP